MITVVVVDDQPLVRAGLRALLDRAEDIDVIGEAGDGVEGVAVVREVRPDVVLMDIRMPGMDGLSATREIIGDSGLCGTRVLVLTTFDTDDHIFDAIRVGAAGFLLKDARPDALRDAVRTVAAGDALLSPAVTRRVMDAAALGPRAVAPERLHPLTERELDVLRHVALGCTNDEIAGALHISPATARTYVSRLLTKLKARDRSQLVVIAYETRLVTPQT